VGPQTPEEWAAHRRAYFLACDRERASHMHPVLGWLYLKRFTIGFLLRWTFLFGLTFITPWAWLLVIGVPLFSLLMLGGWSMSHTP
jgi:hypothetical protein